ncbi:MAG: hypothetical protein HY263_10490 [Chloroflexi bacterium]|nr:hypothetical protein [Chloroflexota bacterium]
MALRFIIALALALHAGMHLSFFMPDWFFEVRGTVPFDLTHSDALASFGVDPGLWQLIGTVLVTLTIVGLILGALSLLGLVPSRIGLPGLAVGASASIVSILLFFHTWLVVGIMVDLAILSGVAVARWLPKAIDT